MVTKVKYTNQALAWLPSGGGNTNSSSPISLSFGARFFKIVRRLLSFLLLVLANFSTSAIGGLAVGGLWLCSGVVGSSLSPSSFLLGKKLTGIRQLTGKDEDIRTYTNQKLTWKTNKTNRTASDDLRCDLLVFHQKYTRLQPPLCLPYGEREILAVKVNEYGGERRNGALPRVKN